MFHLSIEGYRKTPPYRSYYCCKSSSFIVNGIIQKSSHRIVDVRHDVITPRKRRRRDADMLSSAAAAARRRRTALHQTLLPSITSVHRYWREQPSLWFKGRFWGFWCLEARMNEPLTDHREICNESVKLHLRDNQTKRRKDKRTCVMFVYLFVCLSLGWRLTQTEIRDKNRVTVSMLLDFRAENVIVQLVETKCLPVLYCVIEGSRSNKSDVMFLIMSLRIVL